MSDALQAINLPISSSDNYVQYVNHIPMLTLEQEQALAKRWYEDNDVEAAKQLVMAHLRFVVKVARQYSGYGLNLSDLIQEGNIGLMKAVKRFDPSVGVRLVTFAVHWIKSEIHEFIIRNWRIVKIATTKAQRKLFFNLRSFKKRLGWFSENEISDVAQELGVSTRDVREMESRMNAFADESFDSPVDSNADEQTTALVPADYLTSQYHLDPAHLIETSREESQDKQNLQEAFVKLDARSQDILNQRWLADKKATLHDLAEKYNVSAERIRQLEKNAMNKIKSLFN